MDLRQIENIVAIADERSITKAAEKRFITQSALSQQLQKLEQELGTPLFYRVRGNWQPTAAGEAYLKAARSMLLLRQDAYHQIADCAEKASRRLAVGLIPERGVEMFTSVYPQFHREFPQTRVEPVECSVRAMQRMISHGELDLGLATLSEEQKDENEYHLMAEEEIVLAIPASHAQAEHGDADWRKAQETDLRLFSQESFVRIYRQSTLHDISEPLFQAAGFSPRVLFSTSSNISKFRVVEAGLGCALLPTSYAKKSPSVVYLRLRERPRWMVTMCSRLGAWLGAPEQLYLRLCRDYWQRLEGQDGFVS